MAARYTATDYSLKSDLGFAIPDYSPSFDTLAGVLGWLYSSQSEPTDWEITLSFDGGFVQWQHFPDKRVWPGKHMLVKGCLYEVF
jgi:hypothetical protein